MGRDGRSRDVPLPPHYAHRNSTVLGMIPIATTIFWGPMSYAIMEGLLVATVLTLIFLPALYIAWFQVKQPVAGTPGRDARSVGAA